MIEIFGKPQCPFCDRAIALCEQRGYKFTYKSLGTDFGREEMLEMFPTARTFPQIRIKDENIGGYDQLVEYVKHGNVWED
jgi:glutaredoxin|tara:strand:- start:1179 stop:1418 length:240 start_codon:yes stop_codon:yes gene_type:complete